MARVSPTFNRLYRSLNPEQKKAVDTIEGPVMVIAGPGTGKTQVLTLRIANILLRTDASPENILALTFTEAGAHTMRRRLSEIIGASAYRVHIGTFHGFCAEVIRTYPEAFPRIIGAALAPEVEQITLIRKIIGRLSLEYLKPFGDPLYYVRPVRGALEHLKRENIDAESFSALVKKEQRAFSKIKDLRHTRGAHKGVVKARHAARARHLAKNAELAEIYHAYQDELAKRRLYDYNDMVLEVIRALERDRELLLSLQEQYLYLLADEHQDANSAQNRLLELLAAYHSSPNLFIVGDEMQAIFRFQGASLENFLYFARRYPRAARIELSRSYRSTQRILDSSHSLVARAGVRRRVPLRAASGVVGKKVEVRAFSKEEVEHAFAADTIEALLKKGTSPHEIAVIYRDNKDVFPLARKLEARGIGYVIESDENIFDDPSIRQVIVLLQAIVAFGDDEHLAPALHLPFLGLEPLLVWKVLAQRRALGSSVFEILKEPPRAFAAGERARLRALYGKLSSWKILAESRNLADFFETIVRESGALAWILEEPRPYSALEKLDVLYDELAAHLTRWPGASLGDFMEHLRLLAEHEVLVRRKVLGRPTSAVRLMTAHRAKGQEFDVVLIIGAYDGHWGSRKIPRVFHLPPQSLGIEKNDEDSDERRLFYVALTRARRQVFLSYSRFSHEGRERLPSRFIEEIEKSLLARILTDAYEKNWSRRKAGARGAPPRAHRGIRDTAFVKELFALRGFSVTALNNYLRCPWEYFYVNLLRVPRALSPYQMYGTAVHYALTRYFAAGRKDAVPPKRALLQAFDEGIERLPLTGVERARYRARGRRALTGYVAARKAGWRRPAQAPFLVRGVSLGEGVTLRGELDKVEFVGSGGEVNVVDWKTGAPRSRRAIVGSTGDGGGDYYRQLVFYRLLIERAFKGKYRMVSGEIDFVEPTRAGRYRKEQFEISDRDVHELEALIKTTAAEIVSLSFWNKGCRKKDCRYCALRAMMVARGRNFRYE